MAEQTIIKKRDKCDSVAVFRDEYTDRNGEIRTRFSVSIQRSYKDKNGEWKQQSLNCFAEDLLPFSSLLEQTYIELNKYIEDSRSNKAFSGQSEKSSKPKKASAPITDEYDDDIPF